MNKSNKLMLYEKYNKENSCEFNSHEVVVVPDESLSVQEILEKFARGVLPDVSRQGNSVSEEEANQLLEEDTEMDDNPDYLTLSDTVKEYIDSVLARQTSSNKNSDENTREEVRKDDGQDLGKTGDSEKQESSDSQ